MSGKIPPPIAANKKLKSNASTTSLYDCAQTTSIMSTNALAFLLLTQYREGASIDKLVNALDNLRKELEYARRDIGFTGDSIDVINYAVEMLGPALVRKERINNEEIIKPIAILPNVIELTYYSNTLVTHFALESIVAIAIDALDKTSGSVIHQDIVENVLDLCDILQLEFLFCKPCQSLEHTITSCIDELVIRKQIFLVDNDEDAVLNARSRRIAKQFEDNDDEEVEECLQKIYKVNPNKSAVDTLKHLKGTVMPLIESYSITAFTLDKLVGRQLLEEELLKDILAELESQLVAGTIKYGKYN
ncbi:hypothetical protein NQ314_013034 [Rhamnusium bicolor]|uniref:GPAT/DHAPAT C-terminal domain-containing protein n=1 Tax=Rhamnusium bicolor TaxID=1586634 RepID=A0AAV8X8T9_9CUCU|nr:hypothetical protein NQ314_013034 [Rhamnusium bicolor]